MRIVTLDQNAISNLAKNGHEPFWRDLRELLIAGVKARKLLCPIPKETIVETIPCSREVRIKIRDLQHQLSLGFSFKPFWVIENEETLALVRSGTATFPYEQIVWHSVEDDALAQTKAKEMGDAQEQMRQRADAFVVAPEKAKRTIKELRSDIIEERAGAFFRQVELLIDGAPLDPCDDLYIDLCRFLVARRITKSELEQMRQKILTHEWETIPLLFYHAALGAILDFGRIRGRKYKLNDETDLMRIAVALHSSAMMITDKSMACLVKQLEKELRMSLDVFAIGEHETIKTALQTALAA